MGMSAGKGGDLNSEINVTPLVDVMLVLLIIFMVTAPMLAQGLDIDLPQAQTQVIDSDEGKLFLFIEKNGQFRIGDKPMTLAEVKQQIAGAPELFIGADKDLPYGLVLQVMAMAREEGVTKLMMLTDPLDKEELEPR